MSSSRLCAPEDVQDQINRMNKCYREFRVKLREFLGIDKEHDVAITRKEPDYRYTSWNGQLLAERKQQEASVGQGQEQEPEEKPDRSGRPIFADERTASHTRQPERHPAAARRAIRHRRTAADVRVHGGAGARRHGRSAIE